MADEPAYIRNLRALTRSHPKNENLEALQNELYASGSDRATVVLFGSFVEVGLEALLASKMRDDLNSKDKQRLFEFEGAVGTFSSKIIVAYALKFIGRSTRFDLDLIRLLRNEFAHSRMPFDFNAPEVKAVCDQFRLIKLPGASGIPLGYVNSVPDRQLKDARDIQHPRTRYISSCHEIVYRLSVATHGPRAGDFTFLNDDPVP